MRVHVLGTGTSTGVPVPGCDCKVCLSSDPRNKRLRTSIYLELPNGKGILVDTGPDLRAQVLRAGIRRIDAVLYTHTHADHIFGIDDLRPFNFINRMSIPLYAEEKTAQELAQKFGYCFFPDPDYEGGAAPQLTLERMEPYVPLELCEVLIQPLRLFHGSLEVLGFRIGDFAYLTDCSEIPDRTRELLEGVEVLIIDGLRMRPHRTHFNLEGALREIELIQPAQSYLIHISHEVDHEEANAFVKSRCTHDVQLAYDGMILECS